MGVSRMMTVCILVVTLAVLVSCQRPFLGTRLDCPAANEQYMCGSACQTECATLNQSCPIVNIRCNDACYCVNGYARDDSGKCIPIQQCNTN